MADSPYDSDQFNETDPVVRMQKVEEGLRRAGFHVNSNFPDGGDGGPMIAPDPLRMDAASGPRPVVNRLHAGRPPAHPAIKFMSLAIAFVISGGALGVFAGFAIRIWKWALGL